METKQVTLEPGESQQVVFGYTPETAKLYGVTIDGLAGSFEAVMPLATLYGEVKDASTFYQLEGVKATLNGLTTYTGERPEYEYRYIFEDLEPRVYTITFSKLGYETLTKEVTLAPGFNELNVMLVQTGILPSLAVLSYSWEEGQPYEPQSEHMVSINLKNLSSQQHSYELQLWGGGSIPAETVTLAGGETYLWEPVVAMPHSEGYHEFRLFANCEGYTFPSSVGTVEVRIPGPPPEEAEFLVEIGEGIFSAPAGEHVHFDIYFTNLSDIASKCYAMMYLDGVPFASVYWRIGPINPGATVKNPSPWPFGVRIMRPVAGSKDYKMCAMSVPTQAHKHCAETVLTWY